MTPVYEAQRHPTVFLVEDDAALRNSLAWLLQGASMAVEAYATAEAFLRALEPARPGCLVADIRLPGMSGVALQEELRHRRAALPIILITGYGEVSTAVKAMKSGAIDFIQKPFGNEELLSSIRRALDLDLRRRRAEGQRALLQARFNQLTPREREIMRLVIAGAASKVIAFDLGISAKTVEIHRAQVMRKMQVRSVAELVRVGVTELSDN
jgi:two-component system response regulator FixJ